jgi:hypothetical protein
VAGRYNESIQWAETALRENSSDLPALRELAASHALLGQQAEAQAVMDRLRKVNPAMVVRAVKEWLPLRRPDDLARLEEGLRKAGLPEQ